MRVEKLENGKYRISTHGVHQYDIISHKEAEDLFVSLLTTLPNVPERIKTLWELRCTISCEITHSYEFDKEDERIREYYRGKIKQGGETLYVGTLQCSMLQARESAFIGYGAIDNRSSYIVIEDQVSKIKAEEDSVLYAATKYCQANGITLKQLFAQATQK